MKRLSYDEILENRHTRRLRADDLCHVRMVRREAKADKMVGTLCRGGAEVCYIYPPGGEYREGTRSELVAFLLRNHYV